MSDYTRGDDPAYNGFREGWAEQEKAELQARIDELEQIEGVTQNISLDRLREICAAERDGRCVVLPDCSKCVYQQNGNMSLACSNCIGEQKFDNDLFTREEAEAALAKEGVKP